MLPALSYFSAPGRWVLAVTVLGSGIAALDATVVNIALPVIGRDFQTGIAALQWVMTGYTLTLAAFLLIGGSLGDRFGRRKVYLIGIVWFPTAVTSASAMAVPAHGCDWVSGLPAWSWIACWSWNATAGPPRLSSNTAWSPGHSSRMSPGIPARIG